MAAALGYFGAEVVHIESRMRPDGHRGGHNPAAWNTSPTFVKLHRNFESVTLNLQSPEGLEAARQLAQISDVVVENFSLDVLPKLGLDYGRLRAIRPDIIMISLRGFGSTGPWAGYATWGPNLGAILGMTHLWNYPGSEAPTAEARSQHPDFMSGVCGAFAVMSALIHRRKTGEGQWIDTAQAETGALPLGPIYLDTLMNGRDPRPLGNRSGSVAPQGVYRCAGQDHWCAISIETDAQWRAFRRALGDPAWAQAPELDSLSGRMAHHDEIDEHIESWTGTMERYDIMRLLQRYCVPCGVVQDVEDLVSRDSQLQDRGFLAGVHEPEIGNVLVESLPVRLSETPGSYRTHAPLMGEHTKEVCVRLLGIGAERLQSLQHTKAFY